MPREDYDAISAFATAIGANWRGGWSSPGTDAYTYTFIGTFQRENGRELHLGWSQNTVWQLAVHYWRGFVEDSYWMESPTTEVEALRIAFPPPGAGWRDGLAATREELVRFDNAIKKFMRYKHGAGWHRHSHQ